MKRVLVIMLIGLMVLPSAMALAEKGEDPITGSVKTVGKAAEGTVKTAVSPFEAMGRGEPDKVVTDPVEQGGKTVYQATENTGKALTGKKVD